MDTLHGWFSMSAYDNGSKEFIYLNPDNQETHCTFITHEKTDPYENSSYNDSVYCGIVTTFLYSQTKFDNNFKGVLIKK
jgi:hypothetical protein